jgi:hypothetical protein
MEATTILQDRFVSAGHDGSPSAAIDICSLAQNMAFGFEKFNEKPRKSTHFIPIFPLKFI